MATQADAQRRFDQTNKGLTADPRGAEEGGPPAVEIFLSAYASRLAVVATGKSKSLYVRCKSGFWADASSGYPIATGAVQLMVRDLDLPGQWGQRRTDDLRTALFMVCEEPERFGVARVSVDQMDREPIFPLRTGGAIDARTLETLEPEQIAARWMTETGSIGLDYRPDLLDADDDHPGILIADHYEPDRTARKRTIIRRLAYLLLQPRKAVDVITLPVADSGKTTLCRWVSGSLPGLVGIGDAVPLMSQQGQKFTSLQQRLAESRLLFLDEVDKVEKPLTAGTFNALTADFLTVEPKGKDSYETPRVGNTLLVGAAAPHLELGQGGRERLSWAFDGQAISGMSPSLRTATEDPEAQAWLCTQLLYFAKASWDAGDTAFGRAEDGDTRAAAARIHHETATDLQRALYDILERTTTDQVLPCKDIKTRLCDYGYPSPESINSRTFHGAMQAVFGKVSTKLVKCGSPTPVKGYPYFRLK